MGATGADADADADADTVRHEQGGSADLRRLGEEGAEIEEARQEEQEQGGEGEEDQDQEEEGDESWAWGKDGRRFGPVWLAVGTFVHEVWLMLQHANILLNPLCQRLDRRYGVALVRNSTFCSFLVSVHVPRVV